MNECDTTIWFLVIIPPNCHLFSVLHFWSMKKLKGNWFKSKEHQTTEFYFAKKHLLRTRTVKDQTICSLVFKLRKCLQPIFSLSFCLVRRHDESKDKSLVVHSKNYLLITTSSVYHIIYIILFLVKSLSR